MITGMMMSRALLSIGMVGIFLSALLHPDVKQHFRIYYKSPVLISFGLLFLLYPISILWSDDVAEAIMRVNARIAFLLLPFGFIVLRSLSQRHFIGILSFFLSISVLTSLFVLGSYFVSLDNISDIYSVYKTGRVMQTPYSHVRFSILIAFAVFTGIYLYHEKTVFHSKNKQSIIIASVAFLILFLHMLAVRSGLITLYTGSLFLLFRFAYLKRQWIIFFSALILMILLPIMAYKFVPSFEGKINYMIYDWKEYFNKGNTAGLSDATRLLSMEKGIHTGLNNFWAGTGIGDLKSETDKLYTEYPEIPSNKRLPHNQFIWVFASTGIVGLMLFIILFFYPWISQFNFRNPMISLLYIVITVSFITEATIEEQIGSAFFLIFVLLFHQQRISTL